MKNKVKTAGSSPVKRFVRPRKNSANWKRLAVELDLIDHNLEHAIHKGFVGSNWDELDKRLCLISEHSEKALKILRPNKGITSDFA